MSRPKRGVRWGIYWMDRVSRVLSDPITHGALWLIKALAASPSLTKLHSLFLFLSINNNIINIIITIPQLPPPYLLAAVSNVWQQRLAWNCDQWLAVTSSPRQPHSHCRTDCLKRPEAPEAPEAEELPAPSGHHN
jgi:hypothetical protein